MGLRRVTRVAVRVFDRVIANLCVEYTPPLSGLLSAALLFSNFQVGGIGQ
jgi:hypothetical protein